MSNKAELEFKIKELEKERDGIMSAVVIDWDEAVNRLLNIRAELEILERLND